MKKWILLGLDVGLTVASNSCLAAILTINNASFEDPVQQPGDATYGIPGWTGSPRVGTWNPYGPYTGDLGPVPDGNQVGWIYSGTISQTLAYTLQPNTTYTLSIEVGGRTDGPNGYNPGVDYGVSLLGGATTLASVVPAVPPTGSWTMLTAVYSAGAVVPSGNLGIQISALLDRPNGADFVFDNVTLNAVSAVPEPTTMVAGLGALGVLLVAPRARSRRSNAAANSPAKRQ